MLMGDIEYRTVAREEQGDKLVSTVWLGTDHNFGDGPPIIFESMVFGTSEDSELENPMLRYSTEKEAIEGHAMLVSFYLAESDVHTEEQKDSGGHGSD